MRAVHSGGGVAVERSSSMRGAKPPGAPAKGGLPSPRSGEEPLAMESRLPRVTAVEREKFLIKVAAGHSVPHVGFADTGMRANAQRDDRWIHSRLSAVASRLVG